MKYICYFVICHNFDYFEIEVIHFASMHSLPLIRSTGVKPNIVCLIS